MAVTYPIDVKVNPRQAVSGSDRVKRSLRETRSEADRLKSSLLGAFAALGAGAVVSQGIGLLASFSQEMSTVQAVSGATRKEFELLRAEAQRLGTTTRFSATQAAEGMTFLARAGFDSSEVLGTIEGSLQLAQAGAIDLGSAADIASNALQGFRLEVAETQRIVDVMALTVNSSNTDMRQLGDAMKYVAPIAAGLGVDVEATAAAVGALSNAGLQGEMAGTGLRRVMIGLEQQSNEGERVLRKYGLTIEDIAVTKTGDLTESLRILEAAQISTADAMTLFGLRGGPAFEVLTQAVDDIAEMEGELDNAAGTAERMAEIMDDNLNGSLLATRSAIEGLILAIGDAGVTDLLIAGFDSLSAVLRFSAENADILTGLLAVMAVKGVGSLTASLLINNTAVRNSIAGFMALQATAGTTTAVMTATTAAVRTTSASLLALAASNPVTLSIIALAGAFVFLRDSAESVSDIMMEMDGTITDYRAASSQIERDTELLEERNRELEESFDDLGAAAQNTATLELDAIARRIEKNEELRDTYKALLETQLAAAEAAQQSSRDDFLNDYGNTQRFYTQESDRTGGPSLPGRMQTGFEGVELIRRSDEEYRRLAESYVENRRLSLISARESGERLTEADRLFLEASTEQQENLLRIERMTDALRRIDEAGGPAGEGEGETGAGGGGDATPFSQRFEELQRLTAAIGENEAAQERANAVRDFAKDIERELTEEERARVEAELLLQQSLRDRNAFTQRAEDLQREIDLVGLSGREAEIRVAIFEAERDSLLGLSDSQRERIRALIEERQAAEDLVMISDRIDQLDEESRLLNLVGVEARIANEQLRLMARLERDLTDAEASAIEAAVRFNEEMQTRNQILTDATEPQRREREHLEAVVALYREGQISLAAYNAELQGVRAANAVRNLDSELRAAGADVGLSEFEQQRRQAEMNLRRQEGGGVDDGSDQMLFGMTGQELGVSSEMEQLRLETQERLDIIREARDLELLTEEEFQARKEAILQQSVDNQRDVLLQGLNVQLAAAESLFGSLTDIARDTLGEQSGVYKAMFAVQKAFAIAQAIVNIQRGISEAAALPFPANLGAMASVAAATASIVSNIQAVALQFKDGGLPIPESAPGVMGGVGGPREDANLIRISRGEFIMNAESTRKNLGLLKYINENGEPPYMGLMGKFASGGLPFANDNGANDNYSMPQASSSRAPVQATGTGGLKIIFEDHAGVKLEAQQVGRDEIRLIARSEASDVVKKEAPGIISSEIGQPNSRVVKSLSGVTKLEKKGK